MKLPKALNEATAGAALKYHIQRALERSHTISAFTKNLELSAKNSKFSNATMRKIEEITQGVKSAKENITKQEEALQDAITPLKEFGKNYPEFVLKPKEALEKLLQEKNGQVAGAAFRDDLGGIDFVWGKDGKDGYGLAHILERREYQALSKGLNQREAKEYALNVVKSIPEIIEKGVKVDNNGRIAIEYKHMRVGLNDKWDNQKLENKWVISSYEIYNSESGLPFRPIAQLQEVGLEPSKLTEPNPTTNALKNQAPLSEQANAEKLRKLQDAITPLKEFGKNYPEFVLKPKEALEKLLQEKNGQVAGAAFRDDLGGIDFVWGKDGKDGYGLAHILEKREKQYTRLGLNAEQIKERTDELLRSIPEVIENGALFKDDLGRVSVELNNIRVELKNTWDNNNLNNHFVVTSYERDEKVLRGLETKPPLSNDYKDNSNYSALNLNESNPTKESLTSQEPPLSILEKSQLEKQKKLESERLAKAEKEYAQKIKYKEEAELRDKIRAQKNATLGKSELDREIAKSENIPYKEPENAPKTSVSLNDNEIHPLKFVIVNKSDLKPNFKNTGTQTRTAVDSKKVEEIAKRFDPKLIIGRGGFDDLPIILQDGQVIAGNHRIQGMLNFTPKSRYIYHKAIQEYYHIDLKPDELLVRVPNKRLDNTEINNLAASSNQGRFNSESDHAIAVLSHYEAKLKELDQKLDADSIYSLKNIVAKNLNFDKATHPNVGDSNLALLMYNMPRTKTQGIELLNRWQKEFSNDIKSYEKVKKMFVDNAGSFHNLIHDMNFPKVSLNAYLSDIMDRSFANLKNYQTTSESLKDLSEKFYKTSSLDMFEKSDQTTSDISEILGGAIARFARFDDPSKALFEALKSDNIKKGLKEFKIADVTKDMFDPKSKEFKDIDIYDFTHYLLMVNREPNENNPVLNRLIQAVKDMQKENEKGSKPKLETQWGPNYSEFKNDGLGAINKLLETKKGFVAGAFHKEGLGDIDLVWGNKDYGLEHILKRREKQAKNQGLNEQQAKEYAINIAKTIPEVIEKGVKVDNNGRMAIEYQNIRVGINNDWYSEKLPNKWVISSYEIHNSESEPPSLLMAQLQGVGLGTPKLTEPNPTTNALKTQEPLSEQANAKKLLKLQHAITPLKEFGKNYPEFSLKPKEALEKLLQEKNGQVAGTTYREDLGGIDFVWRTPKTKDSNGYGLAHILEKREKQYKRLGLTNEQAKERTKELLKQIPEVIEKGIKDNDYIGHATIRHNGIEVGLSSQKGNTPLKNHYMITSFETDEKVLRELETIGTLSNNYRDGINYSTSNPNEPNPTTNALKTQETLSEQANAKKLLKLESEKGIKAEALKKLNFDEIKKLIDESPRTGSSMPILGMQNLNAEAVEYIQKNHKRIAVEKIEPSFAKDLKLKYPDDARAVIDYQAINHILKEHKNLSFEDIANYRELSKQANETLKLKDNQNRPVVASFNQINGFFVVVEQVSNAKNELMLKTMYKARGNYKDSLIYKRTLAKSQNSN
ncbi:DUF3519 domain-containing protein [Helicobacter pylori]|uniref:DUF3519 domain-containing protein n=1 Tax=Helicobacter pylori TaxID=210 RepID=UPI0002EAB7AE|nr:DUF3519 domain-containing protein [Helicobacter pylori]